MPTINVKELMPGVAAEVCAEIQEVFDSAKVTSDPKEFIAWCHSKENLNTYSLIGMLIPGKSLQVKTIEAEVPFDIPIDPQQTFRPAQEILNLIQAAKTSPDQTVFFKHTVPDGFVLTRLIKQMSHSQKINQAFVAHLQAQASHRPFDPFDL